MDNAHALPRQGRTGSVVPVSQFGEFPRLRAKVAEQVRTRVDEAVRGVWRRFRGCLSCWIVVQSGRTRQGASPGTAGAFKTNEIHSADMADGSRPCVERATGRTTHRSIPQLEAIRLPLEVAEGETLWA